MSDYILQSEEVGSSARVFKKWRMPRLRDSVPLHAVLALQLSKKISFLESLGSSAVSRDAAGGFLGRGALLLLLSCDNSC